VVEAVRNALVEVGLPFQGFWVDHKGTSLTCYYHAKFATAAVHVGKLRTLRKVLSRFIGTERAEKLQLIFAPTL
jgi:hypothetical protein